MIQKNYLADENECMELNRVEYQNFGGLAELGQYLAEQAYVDELLKDAGGLMSYQLFTSVLEKVNVQESVY